MAKTVVCSFSELDTYRQCALKHQLAYIERWQTEDAAESLVRGKLFHAVMEQHYLALQAKQRLSQAKTAQDIVDYEAFIATCGENIKKLLFDPETGEQHPLQENVEWMYRGYLDHYTNDSNWQIVAVERKFEEWLPTERGTRSSFRMKGTLDLVVRDLSAGGGLWIVDHKTCKTLPKQRDIDFDDQFAIYEWLMRKRGNNIRGVIYNAVRHNKLKTRELMPHERFKRHLTVRTQEELNTIAVEAYVQLRRAWREGIDRRPVPRTPDGDRCGWRCSFTEQCLAGRKGHDMRGMLINTGFVQNFERH